MESVDLNAFRARMEADGLPEVATRAFLRAVEYVAEGGATTIAEDEIEPTPELPALESLAEFESAGREAAGQAVVIKLNGGLGTSMGLSRAKSLLPVRPGLSFLDLIARQVLWQREHWGIQMPLVFMNSYRTRDDTLEALSQVPGLGSDLPLDFLQHRVPRIDAESWRPVEWAQDPSLEWCPPGHGDLYIALASSGMLSALRERGIRYAFVSNADNLGATLDLRMLGWVARNRVPFAMEVAARTAADRKGGHLASRENQLLLREVAQCPKDDLESFQDIERHRYFNTNNLWIDLDALFDALSDSPSGLPLPVIRNEKRVSPADDESPRCYQLETAMGSAIECFDGASAVVVPRERFAPVKTTNDLLALWSDAYRVTDDWRMVATDEGRNQNRVIDLDPRYYAHVQDLEARFPAGAPSLDRCTTLKVRGDHVFGRDVICEGQVELVNSADVPVRIADATRLGNATGA